LYGSETWYVAPEEEQKLRVFENGVQRIIFGLNREEVVGHLRRLHSESFIIHNSYTSPTVIRLIV
jgi:hypothetical protein